MGTRRLVSAQICPGFSCFLADPFPSRSILLLSHCSDHAAFLRPSLTLPRSLPGGCGHSIPSEIGAKCLFFPCHGLDPKLPALNKLRAHQHPACRLHGAAAVLLPARPAPVLLLLNLAWNGSCSFCCCCCLLLCFCFVLLVFV